MTVSPVVYESRAYGAIPIVRTAHFKTRDGRPIPVARDRHRGEIRNLLGGGGRLIMYSRLSAILTNAKNINRLPCSKRPRLVPKRDKRRTAIVRRNVAVRGVRFSGNGSSAIRSGDPNWINTTRTFKEK